MNGEKMKNSRRMLEIASAMAVDMGPRFVDRDTGDRIENPRGSYRDRVVVGYALCTAELTRLYLREGFSLRAKVWEEHIRAWIMNGQVEECGHWYFFKNTGRKAELGLIADQSPAVVREVIA